MMPAGTVAVTDRLPEADLVDAFMRRVLRLNRTIVSDDMDTAADLLEEAVGLPARRHRFPSGADLGSWAIPPSWNVREASLSDGDRVIASYADHPLFVAPYSMPFDGWVTRSELLARVNTSDRFDDAFVYQYRVAYDFHKRLQRWELSLPRRVVEALDRERYHVKIDVDVRPGAMQALEFTVPGTGGPRVALLAHLCHPGQANDGLSGVLAGIALMRRMAQRPQRATCSLIVFPETIGSASYAVATGLNRGSFDAAIFLETMGAGDRLFLKKSREATAPLDLAIDTLVRERPELGVHGFFEGYGNDEIVFNFANINIPSGGVQYFPYAEYHTSRDNADLIDWTLMARSVALVEELVYRLGENRPIALRYPGPPYLSRYKLYADAVNEQPRFAQISRLLQLCDGRHTVLQMCSETGMAFADVKHFFDVLDREGLLA